MDSVRPNQNVPMVCFAVASGNNHPIRSFFVADDRGVRMQFRLVADVSVKDLQSFAPLHEDNRSVEAVSCY